MRARAKNTELSVRAIAGTHVVLLGLNVEEVRHPCLREKKDVLLSSFEALTLGPNAAVSSPAACTRSQSKRNGTPSSAPLPGDDVMEKNVLVTSEANRKHCCFVGFSIQRRDVASGQETSLNYDGKPIQKFHWGDYDVLPGKEYVYTVGRLTTPVARSSSKGERDAAMYATTTKKQSDAPEDDFSDLVPYGTSIEVRVTTEDPAEGTHGIYFNRGAAGSRAYAEKFAPYRRFKSIEKFGFRRMKSVIDPRSVPDGAALAWLSRGLEEALLEFISRAAGPKWALRAAVYEFTHPETIQAFAAAVERGVDVKIIQHCRGTHRTKVRRDEIVKDASGKAVKVWIPDDTTEAASEAIRCVGLKDKKSAEKWERETFIMRKHGSAIMHNKFIILAKKRGTDGIKEEEEECKPVPTEVWTGSTNFTDGGIYGQSNVGHIVRDVDVAKEYLEYWDHLAKDPPGRSHTRGTNRGDECEPMDDFIEDRQPDLTVPSSQSNSSIHVVFSPRKTTGMLQWYADRVAEAEESVMFTAAFGVSQPIAEVLNASSPSPSLPLISTPVRRSNRISQRAGGSASPSREAGDRKSADISALRYVLLDAKPSVRHSDKSRASAAKKGVDYVDYYDFKNNSANRIAYGAVLEERSNGEDEREESNRHSTPISTTTLISESLTGLTTFVDYIHTKYLLIDPLSEDPTIVTGSANFSVASTDKNDENTLVVRGDTGVADVYLTEFLRLFDHFHARDDWKEGSEEERKKGWGMLARDDSWVLPYFDPSTQLYKERLLFS